MIDGDDLSQEEAGKNRKIDRHTYIKYNKLMSSRSFLVLFEPVNYKFFFVLFKNDGRELRDLLAVPGTLSSLGSI